MTSKVTNIVSALAHPRLFGALPAFKDLRSWKRWGVFVAGLYGLTLSTLRVMGLEEAEAERIFCEHTGRTRYVPREGGYRRSVAIVGRQAGKDRIASAIQDYEAITAKREPDGTELYALSIAQDHRSALRTAHRYARAPFELVPALKRMVTSKTNDAWTLDNGIVLASYPCRPQAVRGIRAKVVICSEMAFFRSSENLMLDSEMLRAVTPTLATTGGRLVILSSPYAASGVLYDLHKQFFGREDAETLVWQASAREMNPTLPDDYLRLMQESDPEGYAAEVEGQFRQGLSLLLDSLAIEAAVDHGVVVRPVSRAVAKRTAGYDSSGGRKDAASLSISSQAPDGTAIHEFLKVWPAPHDPTAVIGEASQILREYRLGEVAGDRYAANFVEDAFRRQGIRYTPAEHDKSQIFLDFAGLLNSGKVRLLDQPQLLRELRALERKRGQTRDRVDHPVGQHDDAAVAVALSVVQSARLARPCVATIKVDDAWQRARWGQAQQTDLAAKLGASAQLSAAIHSAGWRR